MTTKKLYTCIICFLLLTFFTACENDEIKLESEPTTFDYGSVILDLDLPNALVAKTDENAHAKFVFKQWSEVQREVMTQNDLIDSIRYEIQISAVMDTTNWLGADWLPLYAESKDSDGFIWTTNNYQAKYFQAQAERGLVEVGLDDESQFIIWYTYKIDFWGGGAHLDIMEVKQSLDGKNGSMINRRLIDGEYSTDHSTTWGFDGNQLQYTAMTPDSLFLWKLYSNGKGILEDMNDCSDRYFWDELGNGVYEKKEIGKYFVEPFERCDLEIVRW